jgi:Skp family chaperone for outer membrane proteins
MNRRPAPLFAVTVAAVGLVIASVAVAQNNVPQRALAVGVIDIGVVFKNYKRKDDLEKQINAQKERLEKQAQAQREEIQKLRKNLDLLDPNSAAFRIEKQKLLREMAIMEVNGKAAEEELKAQVEGLTLQLLDEIEQVVQEYGKANGYDLVMKIDTKGWGDEKFQERIFRAQVSSVLYHDAKTDITNSVLAELNKPARIEAFQKKAGLPPQTPANGTQPPGPK